MCGRYTLYANLNRILTDFAAEMRPEYQYEPRYNIGVKQDVLIVRQGDDGRRELATANWWLIPPGSPEPRTHLTTFNATAERIATSFSFKRAFRFRRCLVPADGWFEFPAVGGTKSKPIKQPNYVRLSNDGLFAFAGVWERWEGKGLTVDSCAIVTTEPSEWFRKYHHREPVIIRREDYQTWLDCEHFDRQKLESLLVAYPDDDLEAFPVTKDALSVRNQGSELIEPMKL